MLADILMTSIGPIRHPLWDVYQAFLDPQLTVAIPPPVWDGKSSGL